MATDVRKHKAPIGSETPRRQAFNDLSLSINDLIPVASVAERTTLVTNLTAAGYPPSVSKPVLVLRADAAADSNVELSVDGTTWYALATKTFVQSSAIDYVRHVVIKAAAQSVTNSTAVVADTHLWVDLPVGTFEVQAHLRVTGPAGGDYHGDWTFGGTYSQFSRMTMGPDTTATTTLAAVMKSVYQPINGASGFGTDGSTTTGTWVQENILVVVTQAGRLQHRWAQDTANASATIVTTDSRLYWQRLA